MTRLICLIAALFLVGAFFLNPGHPDQPQGEGGAERIAAYVAAGHVIANHSNTHPHLGDLDAPRWYDGNTIAIADRRFAEQVLHEKPAPAPSTAP